MVPADRPHGLVNQPLSSQVLADEQESAARRLANGERGVSVACQRLDGFVADLMGGPVSADSAPEGGALFTVELPARRSE